MDKYDEMIASLEKQVEELKMAKLKIEEAKKASDAAIPKCANCQHYRQYFLLEEEEHLYGTRYAFGRTYDGRCVFPRMKNRNPDDVCKYFEQREKRISDKFAKFVCPGGYAYK